ncbi:tripartite tricarboxylate transporter TctB family protein [Bacillus thermotolerans]|uniref:tripartite tricarboxylate transporter TctB family protein n=1 Tax=Bacillus thermotolerans TaxID=1221996 RepID=UPI000580A8EC|nr:tripartite tricarboxylate transporter TctB family protein [Bacillus thermotolerans]KKB35200.1 Tricarboxylate transport protein TctB [Bacillus thermotolerans]
MTKMNGGVWAGIVLFMLSLLIFIQSFEYAYSSDVGPGPGFFPVWISGLLFVLSILYIIESYTQKNKSEEKWPNKAAAKNIVYILAGLFGFVILFYLSGFIPASIVFLFFMFFKGYKWYTSLVISAATSIFLFWLFDSLLGVPLPLHGILL